MKKSYQTAITRPADTSCLKVEIKPAQKEDYRNTKRREGEKLEWQNEEEEDKMCDGGEEGQREGWEVEEKPSHVQRDRDIKGREDLYDGMFSSGDGGRVREKERHWVKE